MNLYCKSKNKEFDLQQTPTHITYMCLMQNDGTIASIVKGKAIKRVFACYSAWLESTLSGVYTNEEEYKEHCECVRGHLKALKDFIETEKNVYFYYS